MGSTPPPISPGMPVGLPVGLGLGLAPFIPIAMALGAASISDRMLRRRRAVHARAHQARGLALGEGGGAAVLDHDQPVVVETPAARERAAVWTLGGINPSVGHAGTVA